MNTNRRVQTATIGTIVDGSIGWLIIDNEAKRNALSLAMWTDLPGAVAQLNDDPAVRVIAVRGAGDKSFVAGADISEFEETRSSASAAKAYDAINVAAFKALKQTPKPTIAMVRGYCLGGGLGIALACDIRLAAEDSIFGIPAARLGIAYPLDAISDIVEAVGTAAAKRLLFTAERIGTAEAFRLGLIGEITKASELETRTRALCATLAGNAPLTQTAAKLAINAIAAGSPAENMTEAVNAAEACFDSQDFTEGRNAFLEKRQPAFNGT